MSKGKIVNLDEYIEKKKTAKLKRKSFDENNIKFKEEEDRLKTLNLFMKVLATMEKESY